MLRYPLSSRLASLKPFFGVFVLNAMLAFTFLCQTHKIRAWLRWGRGVRVAVNRELWVFFGLLVLGVAMDIGNNAPRLAFMAFPAVALFQTKVMEALGKSERSGASAG
jgi:hypothetical protein